MEETFYLCGKNRRMINQFVQYLMSKDGVTIEEIKDDTVCFQRNGYNYVFLSNKNDPNYYRVILPNIFNLEKNTFVDLLDVLKETNLLNQLYKAVKVVAVDEKNVWILLEQFAYTNHSGELYRLFDRSLSVHEEIFNRFKDFIIKKKREKEEAEEQQQ